MKQRKIGVIGGGASGMVAAITAAEAGAEVTLLESGERVGKKILSTGNGKCNLGNKTLSKADYNGASEEWIGQLLAQFGTAETEAFFQKQGLWLKEKNGYLYPLAEQAAVVVDVLRQGLEKNRVNVITQCKITEIKAIRGRGGNAGTVPCFEVLTEQGRRFSFDRIILACGSKAAPKTGSDGSGYVLAQKLGHRVVPVVPALVQLRCRETFFREIAGVRAEVLLTVRPETPKDIKSGRNGGTGNGQTIREYGELQLTDYGISGIPVFQLSRKVNYILQNTKHTEGAAVEISIDFLPELAKEDADVLWERRLTEALSKEKNLSMPTVEAFFTGILNKKLMYLFIKLAGLKRETRLNEADRERLKLVFAMCKDFRVHVTGSNSFDQAQVCAGGVDTAQIDTTMESKLVPGLYFAGELLDVDGRCGGYNLHWAWCSGYLAGKNAAMSF